MKLKRKNMKITENVGYLNRLFLYGMFCALFSLVGTSCSTTKNLIDANDIDYIKFWYMPKWIRTPTPIRDCADIVYATCVAKDSVIMDRKIIREYVEAVNKLKVLKKDLNYDLRITSLIVFKENRKKVPVCISLNGVILKNDTLMKGDKHMLKLIDDILYKHHKVEDWTPDFMKE